MKVFYSWQSDLPKESHHYFLKKCLEKAVRALNSEIISADRPESLELDHDTKGVPGTPDVFATILEKIEECQVFVADVSIVGKNKVRSLMNPNVLIEFGYALAIHGNRQIILVLDLASGECAELPFDLQHKRFPITFDSAAADLKAEEQKLVSILKTAINGCLQGVKSGQARLEPLFELYGPFSQNNWRLDVYVVNSSDKTIKDYRMDLEVDTDILYSQPGLWDNGQNGIKTEFIMTAADRPAVQPGGRQFSPRGANDSILLAPGQSEKAGYIPLIGNFKDRNILVKTSSSDLSTNDFVVALASVETKPAQ